MAALRLPADPEPFTLEHFREWAAKLVLDNGEPLELDDFQEAFLSDVFAGYPECWLVVPEENGKTTLVAALALYHAEFRTQAAVPVAASSREQAEILYRQAEGFVLRSDALHDEQQSLIQQVKGKRKLEVPRFMCLEGYRRINHYRGGRIQVFAADDRTGDGLIPTLGIVEELHRHRDLRLYRTWTGKLRKRNGQMVAISTAGEPGSEFEETRERIRQTADQIERRGSFTRAVTSSVVLHEWAVAEGSDVDDMANVKSANPFHGITEDSLRSKRSSPTMTHNHWTRFVCNLPTRSTQAAITEPEWEAAKTDERIPKGEPIWLGLDVAWKWDTTAAVPLWWKSDEFRLLGPATVLVPPRDGSSLDPSLVEDALVEIHARNPIHTLVMDPSKAEQLASWAAAEFGCTVIERLQTHVAAAADYAAFMEALRQGWLKHSGDRDLTAHAMHAIARVLPYGDARFDRTVSSRRSDQEARVIDALSAAAMVHFVAAHGAEEEPEPFVIAGAAW
jgi:phage terminase large subunit-like protein